MMINVSLLKKQILDLAFSGKLTEHKSNESSDDLIDKLFKNKQKKYASFSNELVNFEIPTNWNWCMTYQAVSLDNGDETSGEKLPYLEVKFLRTGKEPKIIDSGVVVDKGEKLILVDGENSGEVFLANERGYKGSTLKILNISDAFIEKYIFLFIYSCKEGFRKNKTGAAIPHLDKKMLFETPLPIPPLEEQKRIVAKLDEIFAELDKIDEKQTRLATIQEKMEAKILKLAIQGKLVEQRPEEGTGEDLFRLIQQEKQQLIKEGKIKKEKLLPAIEDSEIPFEIPPTWKWVRLDQIVYNHGQKTPDTVFSYIDIGSIDNINNRLNKEENIIKPENAPSRARKVVFNGDIVYSTVRPYLHNIAIIDKKFSEEPIASTGFAILSCTNGVINKYLFRCLLSSYFDNYANKDGNAKGVMYPAISDDKLSKALIPLPPLEEQKRIVAKIEELLPLCRGN